MLARYSNLIYLHVGMDVVVDNLFEMACPYMERKIQWSSMVACIYQLQLVLELFSSKQKYLYDALNLCWS